MGTLLNNQEVNSFSSALILAYSVKINNIKSEEGEEDKDGKIKIREICEFEDRNNAKRLRQKKINDTINDELSGESETEIDYEEEHGESEKAELSGSEDNNKDNNERSFV
ncbi:hypothetical protein RhiirA1_403650 [Rhizophagus irregularis]|uniref:Uncharacterized protein n=1 Tax=Rhizophagus irregularis TaxID=588596 RepID=A0A2N0QTJ2_9GLOM|nr:hypothetical protein RhiirA1_403650 [Rhizophagus irregularis]